MRGWTGHECRKNYRKQHNPTETIAQSVGSIVVMMKKPTEKPTENPAEILLKLCERNVVEQCFILPF